MQKVKRIRDVKYKRWLAGLDCMKCKRFGKSQAAHLEGASWGKRAGDDTCAPLCTVHFLPDSGMDLGCHEKHDRHLETRYWDENETRAIHTAKQTYELWKQGKLDEAEELIRRF